MKATEQYAVLKKENPGTLLLFKMGAWWEFLFEDAVTASRVLGLTLEARRLLKDTVPMAGFPYHQYDGYMTRLVKAGYRVAVCEGTDDAPCERAVTQTLPAEPKLVGVWVAACTPDCEFMKWGLDGDTEKPFPPEQEAEALVQAKYIDGCAAHRRDSVYIIHVFDNGQIKQFAFK